MADKDSSSSAGDASHPTGGEDIEPDELTGAHHDGHEEEDTSSMSSDVDDGADDVKGKTKGGDEDEPHEEDHARKGHSQKVDDRLGELDGATREGLTSEKAKELLAHFGPNALPEKRESLILKFLYFFWNPLAWAMEFAAVLSFVLVDYVDGILITGLLLLNACIGFYEDYSSGNAIAALQKQLAPTCKCVRDGQVQAGTPSVELVPGDVVLLRLGDVVPADCYLLDDGDSLKIDQSSLTGESLPVNKYPGDEIYSGSIVKQGEMMAVVHATGLNTFFGKAAALVNKSQKKSHIHIILKAIGYFCILFVIAGCVAELITQFAIRGKPCTGVVDAACAPLNNMLVLVVGGLPIAMPTILSVTMALGASALAKKKAIVSRLTVVEEIAGMEVLCSDKTGTLTKNELSVSNPVAYVGEVADVMFDAALASKPDNGDAIDVAMVGSCTDEQRELLKQFKLIQFRPFDPVGKKTVAKVQSPEGEVFHTAKGAPQVILGLAENGPKIRERVLADIERLGKAGYRTLGVAVADKQEKGWTMTGLIPMFDPPRDDTEETIRRAESLGVQVKMITGDHLTIAKETARLLGMGTHLFPAEYMKNADHAMRETGLDLHEIVRQADGFAEVFPEDKYTIVEKLQKGNHIVGMTGDGVNDAPALKKANIGIAVSGATDAARGASDIVLTKEGLSVIVDAIIGSRKIFQRMKNYCMYSISVCVRIVLTFGILTLAYDWYFPTIATVMFAIFNDGSMLTIAKDKVKPSQKPEMWNLLEVFGTAIALGTYLTASTVILFHLAVYTDTFANWFGLSTLSASEARGLIYLQVSVSGLATIFVTRSQGFSWMVWRERPGLRVVLAFIIAQTAATILGAYGLGGYPSDGAFDWDGAGWGWVLLAWIWCFLWYWPMDLIKFVVRSIMRGEVNIFRHRFSISLQLVRGRRRHADADAVEGSDNEAPTKSDNNNNEEVEGKSHAVDGYEESVVTREEIAHLPHSLAAKMKRRFHRHGKKSDKSSDDASSEETSSSSDDGAAPQDGAQTKPAHQR